MLCFAEHTCAALCMEVLAAGALINIGSALPMPSSACASQCASPLTLLATAMCRCRMLCLHLLPAATSSS